MNLRTRSIGLLAGSILALGSVVGASAQEAPAVATTAKLSENSSGICSASVNAHNFGEFVWDGGKYGGTFTGSFTIQMTQTISPSNVSCSFTFTGSSLSSSGPDSIEASEISLTTGVTNASPDLAAKNTFSESVATGEGTPHTIGYNLQPAMHQQAPDAYKGTVTVTSVPLTEPAQ